MSSKSKFSLAAMLSAVAADSFAAMPSDEYQTVSFLERKHGAAKHGGRYRLPDDVLATDRRDLSAANAGAGGFLVDTKSIGYLDSLLPASVAMRLGAQVLETDTGNVFIPRGNGGISAAWVASESALAPETTPLFQQIAVAPKILTCFAEISRLALLQSDAEQVVRREMRNAAGAALDAAVMAGTGAAGQPLGIINTAGIGAFTGTSLDRAALRNAQLDVAAANALVYPETVGYATTPAVADILANRQRFTGSDRALWEGPLHEGQVEGARAMSTTGCPAATAIYGDWSRLYIVQWVGGLEIAIDPFTKFREQIVGVRLWLPVDVVVSRPQAFSVASSIT